MANYGSEGVFPIPFRVHEFIDAVGFFQIVYQCSFEASLAFLEFRRLTRIDWEEVCCVELFPYKSSTGNVLTIPERRLPGKNRDHESFLVTEIISKVQVIYKSSDYMTLSDAQEA